MSSQSVVELPSRLTETRSTVVLIDIQRTTTIITELNDERRFVLFIDGFYSLCADAVMEKGGEVIKYMGDSCLALFPELGVEDCIDAVTEIRRQFPALCEQHGVRPTGIRANIVTDDVIIGAFGRDGRRDVMGKAVGAAMVGEGPGINITEAVYRKLPSSKRSEWRKHGGKVTYVMK